MLWATRVGIAVELDPHVLLVGLTTRNMGREMNSGTQQNQPRSLCQFVLHSYLANHPQILDHVPKPSTCFRFSICPPRMTEKSTAKASPSGY